MNKFIEAINAVKLSKALHPIEVRAANGLPPVTIDLARMTKVVQHLLENAAKYSPEGSPIQISAEVNKSRIEELLADGSQTVKVVPWPAVLSTRIAPPCASTMRRAIGRPRPPPRRVEKFSSKMRGRSAAAMPQPDGTQRALDTQPD